MEPVAPVKKAKRRDLMDNIKSRVNAGYNVSHLKKNEKDLKDKVKFFEKKDATGELKEYMRPRYELAKELLGRITEFRPGQPAVMPAPFVSSMASSPVSPLASQGASAMNGPMTISSLGAPAASPLGAPLGASLGAPLGASLPASSTGFANAAPIVNTFNPIPSKSQKRSKGTLKLRVPPTLSSSPIFNPPPASPPPLTIPSGHYDANGSFHVNAVPRVVLENTAVSVNSPSKIFGLLKKGRSKTIKKRLSSPIVNKYLYEATQEFLPLPELYDPYTGRKFAAEEDPMPEIERAYNMLIDIYNKAQRKAATLRKRGSR